MDYLFGRMSLFSLSSNLILHSLRFMHYCLVHLFLDSPYAHIVITPLDATYLLLYIFIHLLVLYSLMILLLGSKPTDTEAKMEAIQVDQSDDFHEWRADDIILVVVTTHSRAYTIVLGIIFLFWYIFWLV